jgi:hypothetical protein
MGGFEHATAKSARTAILEQARALIAQESKAQAEGAKTETASHNPCACPRCGRPVKSEHAFMILRAVKNLDGSFTVMHRDCNDPISRVAGPAIVFAPQGF